MKPNKAIADAVDLVHCVTQGALVAPIKNGPAPEFSYASLPTELRFQVLAQTIDWRKLMDAGLPIEAAERILNNAIVGKPKERYLEPLLESGPVQLQEQPGRREPDPGRER
jgi:hypothetical protein